MLSFYHGIFLGFAGGCPLYPSAIQMLGRSEFALRRGFAYGKPLMRRTRAAGQKAGLVVLFLCVWFMPRAQNIDINRPFQKERHDRRSCLFLGPSASKGGPHGEGKAQGRQSRPYTLSVIC